MNRGQTVLEFFRIKYPQVAEDVERYPCEECGANPGALCTAPSGRVTLYHQVRRVCSGYFDRFGNLVEPEPKVYWDLWDFVVAIAGRYQTWSSIDDAPLQLDHPQQLLKEPDVQVFLMFEKGLPTDFMQDMLLHYATDAMSETHQKITSDEACKFLTHLVYIFQARFWARSSSS